MRVRKLIQRLKGAPLVPIGIVVSNVVFAVMNFRRLKRLETRMVRPVQTNSRPARAAARA
jgi:hypothetical protein